MPSKKPAAKPTRLKKAAPPKAVARRPEPQRPLAASRKSVAATSAKPAVKPAPQAIAKAPLKPPAKAPVSAPVAAKPDSRATIRPTASGGGAPLKGPAVEARPASALPARVIQTAPDAEDGDGVDASSLLSGPRNVKPYVAKRGELYMSKQQLSHFQQILLNWKRDLMEEVDRTVSHMKDEAANFPDPNDRATQEEEFSLELRTRDRERKLIRKIEEALKRIEDGSYGYCLETGEEIGIKRLEARPVATLSIEAQERRERRERQYGDRDDRYR
jgi:DnaK suppressor protein